MATSSKVLFNLETLKAQALAVTDQKIAQAEERIASIEDETDIAKRIEIWRNAMHGRILELAMKIEAGTIEDTEITRLYIQEFPRRSQHDMNDAKHNLNKLVNQRATILAKAESLVPDAEGNVHLTKTQLRDFFGL